jgi:hypothetical protein
MSSDALGPDTAEGIGFEPPNLRQFTVFLDNRVGRLHALVRHLEEASSPIAAISVEESADSALIRLICTNPDLGMNILQKHGFPFSESDVLAVELPRRTKQPLIAICSAMLSGEINIHYAYPLLIHPHGPAIALYVDDTVLAAQILIRKGFTLIGQSDLRASG